MQDAETSSTLLESTFQTIHRERMSDVPILNDALAVQAVGFREWQDSNLGVLITPWFMNLVLMPHETETEDSRITGSKREYEFPAGAYEFIGSYEEGLGPYWMCSLFSPVFEFEDQAAAVATADLVIEKLLTAEATEPETTVSDGGNEEGPKTSISRRDLFRGKINQQQS